MKLYNSLTRTKETFKPLREHQASMYVCGITPYDTTHLGHAFTYLSFDILHRYLKYQGYEVTYVQNVTDIDDDILKKAKELGKDWKELGQYWTDRFLTDLKTMNILMPTHYVKATESIETIVTIVQTLIEKEMAYVVDGNVYFRTSKDPEYGKLSRYSREEMIKLSKERGANPDDPHKEDPLDFIMWQKSLPDEPSWESHWGAGRPGWHIECSAMVYQYIDNNIDIHGGGIDLIYPHHESEIAQSENFTGVKPFTNTWMHTGAVHYEGEKMSKSLGNLIMVVKLLETYSAEAIRYLLLSHHYREPWHYEEKELIQKAKQMEIIKKALTQEATEQGSEEEEIKREFFAALDDDLDTPKAVAILTTLAKKQLKKPTVLYNKLLREMYSLLF